MHSDDHVRSEVGRQPERLLAVRDRCYPPRLRIVRGAAVSVVDLFAPRCPIHRKAMDFDGERWVCSDTACAYTTPDHGDHPDAP